jgi:hypothetical protein
MLPDSDRAGTYAAIQKTRVPLDSQRMLYRGIVLDPEKTLADYRIE